MNAGRLRNELPPDYELLWYRIERVLGQGGFGITYLAEDTKIHQRVAIKEFMPRQLAYRASDSTVIPVSDEHQEAFTWGLQRFLDEARTLARFRHPNMVRVLFYTEANATGYMVMEYERGRGLDGALRERTRFSEQELLDLVLPLLSGLETIHAEGFIHRDIKPANILLRDDGSPVLLDFGAARQSLTGYSRTLTAVVSPGYAPIEQYAAKGARQGPWTDIYAFGATLYHLVSGTAPMDAIERSVVMRGEPDPMRPASELGAGLYSPHFLAAIDAALRVDEHDRPQDLATWSAALRGESLPLSSESPTVASAPGVPTDFDFEAPTELAGDAASRASGSVRAPGAGGGAPAARPSRRYHAAIASVLVLTTIVGVSLWSWLNLFEPEVSDAPGPVSGPVSRPASGVTEVPGAAPTSAPQQGALLEAEREARARAEARAAELEARLQRATAAPAAGAAATAPAPQACARAIGAWRYSTSGTILLSADGSAQHQLGAQTDARGRWSCTAVDALTIQWSNGLVDTLQLAAGGKRMQGTNSIGLSVTATR